MLGSKASRLVLVARAVDDVVPPHVAAVGPVDVLTGAAYDEHVARPSWPCAHRLVDGRLERRRRAAPVAAVGGDDDSLASASSMRDRSASAEKPPNTTECGAPSRAQASIATTASGIIGR